MQPGDTLLAALSARLAQAGVPEPPSDFRARLAAAAAMASDPARARRCDLEGLIHHRKKRIIESTAAPAAFLIERILASSKPGYVRERAGSPPFIS